MSKTHIQTSESVAVIEVTGSVALARLLHMLGVETRARIVGATSTNAAGIVTVVIAGGLAEVQHASSHIASLSGIGETAFFAKPDLSAMELLLESLNIAAHVVSEPKTQWKQRVRSAKELDIMQMNDWNVHELRRYARTVSDFPIKGRMISRASRAELLNLFEVNGLMISPTLVSLYPSSQHAPN